MKKIAYLYRIYKKNYVMPLFPPTKNPVYKCDTNPKIIFRLNTSTSTATPSPITTLQPITLPSPFLFTKKLKTPLKTVFTPDLEDLVDLEAIRWHAVGDLFADKPRFD